MKEKVKKKRILGTVHKAPIVKDIRKEISEGKTGDATFSIIFLSLFLLMFSGLMALVIDVATKIVLKEFLFWSAIVLGGIAILVAIGYILFFKDVEKNPNRD